MNKSKKVIYALILLVLALFMIAPAFADHSPMFFQGAQRQFDLFVNCQPMNLFVQPLHPFATTLGLTQTDIATAVESRLRSVGLYANDRASSRLHLIITFSEVKLNRQAFNILLTLDKKLHDRITGLDSFASTWVQGFTGWMQGFPGTRGRLKALFMSKLNGQLDSFLAEYFRVNKRACKGR